jgi:hypothetical protein
MLTGQAPEFSETLMRYIPGFSESGGLCTYKADISSSFNNTITDIALLNDSPDEIEFPQTSNVIIGINEISPLQSDSST